MKRLIYLLSILMCAALVFIGACKAKPKGAVLVVLSGVDYLTLQDGKKHPTGYFLSELMIPLMAVREAGYKVVFANPTGAEPAMDKISVDRMFFASEEELKKSLKLKETLPGLKAPQKLSTITDQELKSFSGIFVPGGHAPMEDLLKDKDLGRILRHFHAADKPTALICHGPIALLSARDGEDWPYQGYRVTVFSNVEEKIGEDDGAFGGKLKIYPENALSDAGARVINQEKPWQVSVIQDRELITAQNPMSGHKFADVFVENLKGQ